MTQVTAQWLRGIALALNALALIQGLVVKIQLVADGRTDLLLGNWGWMALGTVTPILSIVALVMTKTPDSRIAAAVPD